MSIGVMWTKIVSALKNIPFLDEALWDWGRSWFKTGSTVVTTPPTGPATTRPDDNVLKARRAVGILYSTHVTDIARTNWQNVVWVDPAFKPHQNKVEVALEDLLERYEEREGAFSIKKGAKTTTETGTGDKKKIVTVTGEPQSPRPKFSGQQLFIEALNKAGETPQSTKLFIEGITHERIFARLGDQLGGVAATVKPALIGILILVGLYTLVLLSTAWVATTRLMHLVNNPTSLHSAIVGFIALGIFAWLASPITNRILKG
jgi:hypothetical protein